MSNQKRILMREFIRPLVFECPNCNMTLSMAEAIEHYCHRCGQFESARYSAPSPVAPRFAILNDQRFDKTVVNKPVRLKAGRGHA